MIFIYYLITINIITFLIFGIDKLLAIYHKYRISETTLLFLSLIGGCFLEFIGMLAYNHKTRKIYFYLVNLFFISIYTLLIYLLYHYSFITLN